MSFDQCPTEVIEKIRDQLDFGSLVNFAQSCKTFRAVCSKEDFWHEACILAGFGRSNMHAEHPWSAMAAAINYHGTNCKACHGFYEKPIAIDRSKADGMKVVKFETLRKDASKSSCEPSIHLKRRSKMVTIAWHAKPIAACPALDYNAAESADIEWLTPKAELRRHITLASLFPTTTSPVDELRVVTNSDIPFGRFCCASRDL